MRYSFENPEFSKLSTLRHGILIRNIALCALSAAIFFVNQLPMCIHGEKKRLPSSLPQATVAKLVLRALVSDSAHKQIE